MLFFVWSEVGFEPFGKLASRQHDSSPAAQAFESDIRAETCDGPFIGTARVLFAQTQVIIEAEVGKHVGFLLAVSIINES